MRKRNAGSVADSGEFAGPVNRKATLAVVVLGLLAALVGMSHATAIADVAKALIENPRVLGTPGLVVCVLVALAITAIVVSLPVQMAFLGQMDKKDRPPAFVQYLRLLALFVILCAFVLVAAMACLSIVHVQSAGNQKVALKAELTRIIDVARDASRRGAHNGDSVPFIESDADRDFGTQALKDLQVFRQDHDTSLSPDDRARLLVSEGTLLLGLRDISGVANTLALLDKMDLPAVWDDSVVTLRMAADPWFVSEPLCDPARRKHVMKIAVDADRLINSGNPSAAHSLLRPVVHAIPNAFGLPLEARHFYWYAVACALYGLSGNMSETADDTDLMDVAVRGMQLSEAALRVPADIIDQTSLMEAQIQCREALETRNAMRGNWSEVAASAARSITLLERVVFESDRDGHMEALVSRVDNWLFALSQGNDRQAFRKALERGKEIHRRIAALGIDRFRSSSDAIDMDLAETSEVLAPQSVPADSTELDSPDVPDTKTK